MGLDSKVADLSVKFSLQLSEFFGSFNNTSALWAGCGLRDLKLLKALADY
jgi:hypothetical protein